ncbi:hypothetical protein AVEN_41711-1 [Araneus ventricosus]|uniref:Uncharacterized protein n=1 Tax=Araneus ventricosus TaxID=182803 RepID=A0A4Y2ABR9_ARAVE|nr:hypothetical protein AVEN_41711-1 [Araneus ventricosus]
MHVPLVDWYHMQQAHFSGDVYSQPDRRELVIVVIKTPQTTRPNGPGKQWPELRGRRRPDSKHDYSEDP